MRHLIWGGGGGGGGGERVSEGSAFCIYVFVTIWSNPFCDVQWLAGFPFREAVILYSLFCSKTAPIFFVFCLTYGLKN